MGNQILNCYSEHCAPSLLRITRDHQKIVDQASIIDISQFAFVYFNSLTPRVKTWVIQSFLTFSSMYRPLKCDHSLESC